ncbi:hypothetical protein A9R05_05320 [Burkholderia sp. KK1]|nr:hypothetical protein A9R05_05320 [Burkholderia sp. KK1]
MTDEYKYVDSKGCCYKSPCERPGEGPCHMPSRRVADARDGGSKPVAWRIEERTGRYTFTEHECNLSLFKDAHIDPLVIPDEHRKAIAYELSDAGFHDAAKLLLNRGL